MQNLIFLWAISTFFQQSVSCTLSHRIHSTHSFHPFTSVHSKSCAFFYLSFWFELWVHESNCCNIKTRVCCTTL